MKQEFKYRMTFDEMSLAFVEQYPMFVPNKVNVGRFAKKHGYTLYKQVINKIQTYFYINEQYR